MGETIGTTIMWGMFAMSVIYLAWWTADCYVHHHPASTLEVWPAPEYGQTHAVRVVPDDTA